VEATEGIGGFGLTYSSQYKQYVTGLLTLAYVLNLIDRMVFGILNEPIRIEFGLSDTQMGFVLGPALVIFYAGLGVPIARWADRSHRIKIMAGAIALWSGIVMASAIVQDFPQLILTRICVGIGEAGFSAIAMALIADYHSEYERTRALSQFTLAVPISLVASSLIAGWVNEELGWRAVFVAAGFPGLVIAPLLLWTVQEPAANRAARAPAAASMLGFGPVFLALWRQRTLRHLLIAQGFAYGAFAIMNWAPAFFVRNHGMSTGELGTWFAVIGALGGGTAIWLSGRLTTKYGSHNPCVKTRMIALSTGVSVPLIIVALWTPQRELALVLLLIAQVPMLFFVVPTLALVQDLTNASMRATMASIFILVQMVAAGIVGIQWVGFLSDALTSTSRANGAALRWSMTLTVLLAVVAARYFWLAGRSIRLDLDQAAQCGHLVR
jgi:MFS family permease